MHRLGIAVQRLDEGREQPVAGRSGDRAVKLRVRLGYPRVVDRYPLLFLDEAAQRRQFGVAAVHGGQAHRGDLEELAHERHFLERDAAELRDDPDVKALTAIAHEYAVSLVQLIYRANAWEGGSRDYEFSERTKAEHWQAGHNAVAETIRNASLLATNILDGKTAAFDLTPR